MRHWLITLSIFISACSVNEPIEHNYSSSDNPGWVSSGGQGNSHHSNPWFLENTKEVHYCIQISEDEFSADRKQVEEAVRYAIQFWKDEFSIFHPLVGKANSEHWISLVPLATQEFIEERDCNENTDLRFLFGFNSLSKYEKSQLPQTSRHVGIAVRTHYDLEQLRGKGFIFLNSDLGKDRMKVADAASEIWRHEWPLRFVLIHELGHVFGLPHGSSLIMAEDMPGNVISQFMIKLSEDFNSAPSEPKYVFGPPKHSLDCVPKDSQTEIFKVERVIGFCIHLELSRAASLVRDNIQDLELDIFIDQNSSKLKIGRIFADPSEVNADSSISSMEWKLIIPIYLPRHQKVFETIQSPEDLFSEFSSKPYGGMKTKIEFLGSLELTNQEIIPVHVMMSSEGIRVIANHDGVPVNVISTDRF